MNTCRYCATPVRANAIACQAPECRRRFNVDRAKARTAANAAAGNLCQCGKPVEAKGLCKYHYKQNRRSMVGRGERQVPRACTVCGEHILKPPGSGARSRRPVCSYACRTYLQWGHWPASTWVPPKPKTAKIGAPRFYSAECPECGEHFITERKPNARHFCSPLCKKRQIARRRRAREHEAPGMFRWVEVIRLHLDNDRRCAYCDQVVDGQPDPDHVIPLSRGGWNDLANILPSCRRCNSSKSDKTPDEWIADRDARGLPPLAFDPARWRHLVIRSAKPREGVGVEPAEVAA